MKTIIIIIVLALGSNILSAQNNVRKASRKSKQLEEFNLLIDKLSLNTFEFEAQQALATGGSAFNLTSEYTFKLTPDSAFSYLPFFGRGYSGIDYMSSEGGMMFEGLISDFTKEVGDKKQLINIHFKVKGSKDTYQCYFSVSGKNYGTLTINSVHRSSITYHGILIDEVVD